MIKAMTKVCEDIAANIAATNALAATTIKPEKLRVLRKPAPKEKPSVSVSHTAPKGNERSTKAETCRCGRITKQITYGDNFSCDVCDSGIPDGTFMMGCRVCNWDMCMDCCACRNRDAKFMSAPST